MTDKETADKMGLKYFSEYRTLNTNELWRIEIYLPDYIGTPIEKLAAGGQACIVEHSGGDKLFEKFAIPSSAKITLLFDSDDEIRELQLLPDKTAQVKVLRGGGIDLYWQGYLISDGIQFPDVGVLTPITLNAVDMIEAADDIPFVNIACEAITVDDTEGVDNSPLNWIRKCLIYTENINNRMPIRWSCSLKNLQYPTDDFFGGRTGFIPNYDVFASSRQQTSVGWMLENIVKSADGCMLYQHDGYWYIISLVDLANSSSLSFYEIDGSDLSAKTATTLTLDLTKIMPNKLNESTFSMSQKPISKVKSTYNHSMPSNVIPNGGFDILDEDNNIIYWQSDNVDITLTPSAPINGRQFGKSARVKNIGLTDGFITFSTDGISSMPLDANILFKDMQWGFTFLPINYSTDGDGFINWSFEPLEFIVSYSGYEDNILKRFFLNRFGYWEGRNIIPGGLEIQSVQNNGDNVIVFLTGDAKSGQRYRVRYYDTATMLFVNAIYDFESDMSLNDAIDAIILNTGEGIRDGANGIKYSSTAQIDFFSAIIEGNPIDEPRIPFVIDGMKNNDIAAVQFQSKGNQGRVLLPYPGVLNEMRALESGKFSLTIIIKAGQEVYFDDLYMNVSDNKEFWEISNGGTDGKSEYELEISSSFSGFMTSSYMNSFATSDLSMIMDNGTDRGTLTEIFGKTALRLLSKPTEKIDTEIEGIFGMLSLFSYKTLNFLPLKTTVNTETNSTSATIFEFNYDNDLELTSIHKSTGDGDNSSFSTGGYSGGVSGGGSGGAEFLFELGDVSITTPSDKQALTYDTASGKWVNSTLSISYITGLQSALDAKANDNDVVKLTGNQAISGIKTFSDNVGIGTTTPTSKLNVVGGAGMTGGWRRNTEISADYPVISIHSTANNKYAGIGYDSSDGVLIWVNEGLDISAGTPKIKIANNGNVGFGTTGPLAPIHVGNRGVSNSSLARILVSGVYDNSASQSGHAFSDSSLLNSVGGGKAYCAYDGRIDIQGTSVNMDHYVSFQHGPTMAFTGVLKDNFGIFTTTVISSGTITNNYGAYLANPLTASPAVINVNYGLYIANQTAGVANYGVYCDGGKNYFRSETVIDGTISADNVGANIRIKADGSTAKDGGVFANVAGDLYLSNWDQSRGFAVLSNGNSNVFGGNFGVGTSSPAEKLHVIGNAIISNSLTAANIKATAKLETRGQNSGGTPSGNFYDIYIEE